MTKLTWYQNARLQAIETLANWAGRVNTTDLIRIFSVSRQIAQSDIAYYLTQAPGNLVYNKTEKAYLATSIFKPILSDGQSLQDYFAIETSEQSLIRAGTVKTLSPPQLDINPLILRPILQALKKHTGIDVLYRSLNHPEGENRVIFPHTIVNTGFRWHMRAFCKTRQDFRDFNLSRIVEVHSAPQEKHHYATYENDKLWLKNIELVLKPNPELSPQEQSLIADEFKMVKKRLSINVSASLLSYYLQIYQVPITNTSNVARESRLVIANRKTIEKYFW